MLIIGLTGSIGMGKSTVAAHLAAQGIPVCDADAVVHDLYAGRAVPLVEAEFPGTTGPEGVDRAALSRALAREPDALIRLEALVHPLVQAEEKAFLADALRQGAPVAVLEIPLLFEIGANRKVDVVVVVSAPPEVQRQRVLERPGMTEEKLAMILSRQVPDSEKRAGADYVIDTSGAFEETYRQVDTMLQALAGRSGTAYQDHWS
ncbi:MAG: hypothetical protein RLZ98_411 [Pseudomonadota bacterium]